MGIFYLFIYFVKVKVDWDRIDPMTRLRATLFQIMISLYLTSYNFKVTSSTLLDWAILSLLDLCSYVVCID